ncbi:MAG: tRNA lysidine(34) synthetase TilS [Acidobacteria bacterium]|nr:MAG: tRNA lysidine(34) synthetase TilS [Acidobacteriota bacterium]PYS17091.1 MAG: tRNA lysidine(34) synthetase TilS [Acidobacteriota bacterium]
MLTSHDRVLDGVSGGADSVCLVLVLKELGFEVAVAHVNHGLRGAESDEDEAFTKQLALSLGVRFFGSRVSLSGPNIEAAGREARRTFFDEVRLKHGFTKVALAHTRNDRVETFLMNLLRGSGSEGLVSMAPASGNTIRPLIEAGRDEVEAYLEEHNQPWRTDSSNFDLRFARNRLRHAVIPELESRFNPNLIQTLARTVEILEAEDGWMRTQVARWLTDNGTTQEEDFAIPAAELQFLPGGLVRRILRTSLRRSGSDLRDVSFDHIEAVRGLLAAGKSGKFVEIPGGLQVAREFDHLVFRQAPVASTEYSYELKIPGEVHIPEVGKVFRAEIVEQEANDRAGQRVFVDAETIGPCVKIRNWKPGDYYRPVGLPAGKLKKLFQRARIPRGHRVRWPVIVADSTIVWVASFPVSREFAPRGQSQKKVAFEAL